MPLSVNPLNAELNPICHLLALLGAHPILHISRTRVKLLIKKSLHNLTDEGTIFLWNIGVSARSSTVSKLRTPPCPNFFGFRNEHRRKQLTAYFGILLSRTFDICDELKEVNVARIHVMEKEKCIECFDGETGRK